MAAIGELSAAYAIPVRQPAASLKLWPAAGWLLGWTFAEVTGTAAATVDLWDGDDTTGTLLAAVAIPAGGTVAITPSLPGTPIETFLTIVPGTGKVAGSVTIGKV